MAWVWNVPARARTASWHVAATCGSSTLSASYLVHGKRHRSVLSLARQVRVLQYGGAFPAAPALQLGVIQDLARSWWVRTATSILSQFHAGVATGQCTDYVAAKRPDVIQSVDVWAYTNFLLAHGGPLGVDWTAKDWVANAQKRGPLHRPGPGSRSRDGVSTRSLRRPLRWSRGVRQLGGKRRVGFTISEMHAPVIGQVSTRNFSPAAALAMLSNPQIGFIYR